MTALDDRRQSAREAAHDAATKSIRYYMLTAGVEAAIETATRVQIDRDMLADFARGWHEAPQDGPPGTRRRAGLAAALRGAGFEVVE